MPRIEVETKKVEGRGEGGSVGGTNVIKIDHKCNNALKCNTIHIDHKRKNVLKCNTN